MNTTYGGGMATTKNDRLATQALTAVIDNRVPAAFRYVARIIKECGPTGIQHALYGWIDTVYSYSYAGRSIQPTRFTLTPEDPTTSDTEVPQAVWAKKLIAARVAMDHDACHELIAEMFGTENPALHIVAVLSVAGTTIANRPPGFALGGHQ